MNPVIMLLSEIITLYNYVIMAWVVLSLLLYFDVVNRRHPIVAKIDDVLNRLVEPVLRRIRRYLPDTGGVDLSPIVLLLALHFLRYALWYYF